MRLTKLSAAIVFSALSSSAFASGFALWEISASSQGNAYAGAAANTDDASVMWFNPAGLVDIEGGQAIAGMHYIAPKTSFKNGSTSNGAQPVGTNDDGATPSFVPNFFLKGDYNDFAYGIGVTVPFGSKIEYEDDWAGRYQGTKTSLKSMNLNANIAKRINDSISIGAGINAQYVHLIMSQKINQQAVAQPDGNAEIDADSWGYGFNVGLLANLSEATQVGIGYRSAIKQNAKGKVSYDDVHPAIAAGGSLVDGSTVRSDVTLPASASISLSHQATDKLKFLADVTWTGWKAYDELVIEFASGADDSESNQEYGDSMRYAVGATYKMDPEWTLKTGLALDKTPVPDKEARSVRNPDANRTWLSVGANYRVDNQVDFDFAYTYILTPDEKINKSSTSGGVPIVVNGDYDLGVSVLSAQLIWKY